VACFLGESRRLFGSKASSAIEKPLKLVLCRYDHAASQQQIASRVTHSERQRLIQADVSLLQRE
jgi:hypothetical protein